MSNQPDTKSNMGDTNIRVQTGWMVPMTLLFVILKVTGTVDWSWWWVLSPYLLVVAAIAIPLSGLLALTGTVLFYEWLRDGIKEIIRYERTH